MNSESTPTSCPLQIIPLGGASEIGKNMIVLGYGDDMVVIDAGVTFPSYDHPGVDLILPDMGYLAENASALRAVLLTHGHEDHIGALPFLLRRVRVPIYGTRLTLGLVRAKLEEHGLLPSADLREYEPGQRVAFGELSVEPIRVTHSIPDTVSLAFHTPLGVVLHTGDFKIDQTPVDGRGFDAGRFAQLGDEGVLLLISDSVNAEEDGWSPSEKAVGRTLEQQLARAPGRVLFTTFASNIHRIQQVFDAAAQFGRKVIVTGRSMQRNVRVARELEYLRYPESVVASVDDLESLAPDEVVIVTTGSQGEPLSTLTQIAKERHRIRIQEGDTVILSSTPIPGNEEDVWRTVNRLIRLGARVVYDLITPVHASGHACRGELRLMLSLTRPLYVVPFHGEPRMMQAYTDMAMEMGIAREAVIWLENGDRLGFDGLSPCKLDPIPSVGSVFVDALSDASVSDIILRDRKHLATGGTVVVTLARDQTTGEILSGPDFVARGFVELEYADEVFEEAAALVRQALEDHSSGDDIERDDPHIVVRDVVARFLRRKTGGKPVIVPVIAEV